MEQDFLKKQKNKRLKTRLVILCIAIVAILAVGFAIVGKLKAQDKKASDAKVTIEIRCDELSSNRDMLTDKALVDYIPKDGIIVKKTSYKIKSDETTVMDVLQKACKEKDVQIEDKKGYVRGINYLYEFSAGQKSGWMYKVNGKMPNYMASEVKLKDGDEIVWFYTVDYDKESDDKK